MVSARDDYRKFNELLDLIQQLCKPMAGMTYEDIMNFMGCSRKTAERTIKFLTDRFGDALFVTTDSANTKQLRFRLEMPNGLPPEYIGENDMIALHTAANRIKNSGIQKGLEALEYKLNRAMEIKRPIRELNDMEAMVLSRTNTATPYPHIKMDEKATSALQYAIMSFTKVRVTYTRDGIAEPYTLCPLGFLYGHSNNYLVAYKDGDKKTIRTYILGQLNVIETTKEEFNPGNFDIHKYAKESFGMYHSANGPYDIEWLADADISDAIQRYEFHPTQKFIKNKDGTTTIKMRADGFYEMSLYLFQWGGKIKPVAPKELVDTYHRLLNELVRNSKNN